MTDLLDRAVATARDLPADRQDEIALVMLAFLGRAPSLYELKPEEEADLAASDEEVSRGEFATDERMRAIWAKYGP